MYLSFYHLKRKPFQISTDPRFLWLGEKHEEALATLRYGVLDNKGFLLLTGDVGTGKTTLINSLLKTLGGNTLVASVRDPALEPIDFFNYIAHAFGMEGNYTSKGSFLIQFERFLHAAKSADRKVLLIIDEAQRINQELLEEVRLLSNIEREDSKLLNIFFVGQIEFNDKLLRPENRAIRQRITVNYNIPTLTRKETRAYIQHRLKIAGAQGKIFEENAFDEIFSFAKGYPRLINIICDRSLLTGFVEESRTITRKHVRECVKELAIPRLSPGKSTLPDAEGKSREHPASALTVNSPNYPVNRQQEEKTSILTRYTIYAAAALLLMVASYFSFSKNGPFAFQGQTINRYIQSFLQHNNQVIQKKGEDMAETAVVSLQNSQTQLEKKEIRGMETNGRAEPALSKQPQENKPADGNASINPGLGPVTGSYAIKGTTNSGPASSDNDISSEKKKLDKAGQLSASKEIEVNSLVTFEKLIIPFPTNTNLPPGNALEQLNQLVDSLLEQTFYKVIVTGFTDSQGNETFNKRLSEFRANAVKSYLVGRGLEESRIITRGFGSQHPLAPNDTPSGRTANRRVEIEIER